MQEDISIPEQSFFSRGRRFLSYFNSLSRKSFGGFRDFVVIRCQSVKNWFTEQEEYIKDQEEQAIQSVSIYEKRIVESGTGGLKGVVAAVIIYSGVSIPLTVLFILQMIPRKILAWFGKKGIGRSFQTIFNIHARLNYFVSLYNGFLPTPYIQLILSKCTYQILNMIGIQNLKDIYQKKISGRLWYWTGAIREAQTNSSIIRNSLQSETEIICVPDLEFQQLENQANTLTATPLLFSMGLQLSSIQARARSPHKTKDLVFPYILTGITGLAVKARAYDAEPQANYPACLLNPDVVNNEMLHYNFTTSDKEPGLFISKFKKLQIQDQHQFMNNYLSHFFHHTKESHLVLQEFCDIFIKNIFYTFCGKNIENEEDIVLKNYMRGYNSINSKQAAYQLVERVIKLYDVMSSAWDYMERRDVVFKRFPSGESLFEFPPFKQELQKADKVYKTPHVLGYPATRAKIVYEIVKENTRNMDSITTVATRIRGAGTLYFRDISPSIPLIYAHQVILHEIDSDMIVRDFTETGSDEHQLLLYRKSIAQQYGIEDDNQELLADPRPTNKAASYVRGSLMGIPQYAIDQYVGSTVETVFKKVTVLCGSSGEVYFKEEVPKKLVQQAKSYDKKNKIRGRKGNSAADNVPSPPKIDADEIRAIDPITNLCQLMEIVFTHWELTHENRKTQQVGSKPEKVTNSRKKLK